MMMTKEENPRVRFAKNVVSRSKELGIRNSLIQRILDNDNRMVFLSKLNNVIENDPDDLRVFRVIRRAENMNYAVSVLGPWVLNLTKNIWTLKEMLSYYLEFKAEKRWWEEKEKERS